MGKRVVLPFFIPMFSTHHNAAVIGLAFKDDPNAQVQILNQCMELTCDRAFLKGYSSPKMYITDTNMFTFPNIERHCVSMIFTSDFYKEIAYNMLNRGLYIYLSCVDDYYLPGKSWSGEKHRIHDGIMCGYDDDAETFILASYDKDWMFRLIEIPQGCYAESIRYSLREGNNVRMTAVELKKDKIELDIPLIVKKMKDFVSSDFQKYPTDQDGIVKGSIVYDYLNIYFNKIMSNEIEYEKLDWRPLRLIWEFRSCMQKRIYAMEEKRRLPHLYSEQYASVVEETNRLRMVFAFYAKKRKDLLLESVCKGIMQTKATEISLLTAFIDEMEKTERNESNEIVDGIT